MGDEAREAGRGQGAADFTLMSRSLDTYTSQGQFLKIFKQEQSDMVSLRDSVF